MPSTFLTNLTNAVIDDNNNAPKGLWHPPSPTALTPRKCFNPATLNARTHRAWDRQPRSTTIAIDGKPRTIWKRFEVGGEQDKENIIEEVVVAEGKVCEEDADLRKSPTKKALKKICLAGGLVAVKDWERRDSGLIHKAPQNALNALLTPVGAEDVVEQVEEELPPLPKPMIETSIAHIDSSEDVASGAQEKISIQLTTSSAVDQTQTISQQRQAVPEASEEIPASAAEDMNADTFVEDAHILSLSATQVWTRSKGALRDDTARARGEFSTPSAKAKAAKCSLSPGTELDHLTPSFLKRIFTVLNDNMVVTPRTINGTNASNTSPLKHEVDSLASTEVETGLVITTATADDIIEVDDLDVEEPVEAGADLGKGEVDDEIPSVQLLQLPTPTHLFEDDTQILLDFVSRSELNKAKKAANIAKRTSLANRRDSTAIKAALASPRKQPHNELDEVARSPISISSVLAQSTEETASDPVVEGPVAMDEVVELAHDNEANAQTSVKEVSTAEAKCSRRSTRIPKQATKSLITITRTDGQDLRVLKDAESRALAVSTRANTRRNKGTSVSVPDMLKKLTAIVIVESCAEEQAEEERPPRLRWKDELAQYCEIEAREETTEAATNEVAEAPVLAVQISIQGAKTIPRPSRVMRPAVRRTRSVPVVKEQDQTESEKPAPALSAVSVTEATVRRTPLIRSRSAPVLAKRTVEPIRANTPAAVKDTKTAAPSAAVVTSEPTTTPSLPSAPTARPRRLPQPVRSRSRTPVTKQR